MRPRSSDVRRLRGEGAVCCRLWDLLSDLGRGGDAAGVRGVFGCEGGLGGWCAIGLECVVGSGCVVGAERVVGQKGMKEVGRGEEDGEEKKTGRC